MKAFINCKTYEEYIEIIKNSIDKVNSYKENEKGLDCLEKVDLERRKKIIRIIKLLDNRLSYNKTNSNEMQKKINYILSLGIFETLYKDDFDNLDDELIYTFLMGGYHCFNEYNIKYVPVFLDSKLLKTIKDYDNRNSSLFGVKDIFFMIEQHFNNNPFDLDNKDKLKMFKEEMIKKINNGTLNDGVLNMLDYFNSEEMNELKKKVGIIK